MVHFFVFLEGKTYLCRHGTWEGSCQNFRIVLYVPIGGSDRISMVTEWLVVCWELPVLTSNVGLLTDDQKVAEELNSYFVSVFSSEVDSGKLSVVKDSIINCLIQILSLWWNTPQNTAGTCSSYYLWGTLENWRDGRSLEKHKYVFLSKKTKKVIFLNYCPVSLTTKLRKML